MKTLWLLVTLLISFQLAAIIAAPVESSSLARDLLGAAVESEETLAGDDDQKLAESENVTADYTANAELPEYTEAEGDTTQADIYTSDVDNQQETVDVTEEDTVDSEDNSISTLASDVYETEQSGPPYETDTDSVANAQTENDELPEGAGDLEQISNEFLKDDLEAEGSNLQLETQYEELDIEKEDSDEEAQPENLVQAELEDQKQANLEDEGLDERSDSADFEELLKSTPDAEIIAQEQSTHQQRKVDFFEGLKQQEEDETEARMDHSETHRPEEESTSPSMYTYFLVVLGLIAAVVYFTGATRRRGIQISPPMKRKNSQSKLPFDKAL